MTALPAFTAAPLPEREALVFAPADVERIATACLGEPNRRLSTRRELRFGRRGSVSVDLGRGVWHDHEAGEGGGLLALLMRSGQAASLAEARDVLQSNGLTPRVESAAERLVRQRQAVAERERRRACAWRLWQTAMPAEGSIAEAYLRGRGVSLPADDLRFHPCAPLGYQASATAPAMVVLARSLTGAPQGVQATFLEPSGHGRRHRATFGPVAGGAVRLAPEGRSLAIAEGVETALAFRGLFGVPTWAGLGTAGLESFRPPHGVRRVVIAADGDAAGARAAEALAMALRKRVDLTVCSAPEGSDWADVARQVAHG